MNTTSQYRPSTRPSVKSVKHWDSIYAERIEPHWRGDAFNGDVEVFRGDPFPDFYKMTFTPDKGKKISKLFYGESAWNEVERCVYDLGAHSVLGRI